MDGGGSGSSRGGGGAPSTFCAGESLHCSSSSSSSSSSPCAAGDWAVGEALPRPFLRPWGPLSSTSSSTPKPRETMAGAPWTAPCFQRGGLPAQPQPPCGTPGLTTTTSRLALLHHQAMPTSRPPLCLQCPGPRLEEAVGVVVAAAAAAAAAVAPPPSHPPPTTPPPPPQGRRTLWIACLQGPPTGGTPTAGPPTGSPPTPTSTTQPALAGLPPPHFSCAGCS